MSNTIPDRTLVLLALFRLAERGAAADPGGLARESSLPRAIVWRSLGALDAAGLADRRRMRLTFHGLAVAVAIHATLRARSVLSRAA